MAKKTSLLKFLNELEKEELVEEIEKLCAKFDVVKKYFEIELSGDTTRYVTAAKKEIARQFYFTNGNARSNPKASRLNAIVKEFEQVSIYKEDIIELLVCRIEQTMAYAKDVRHVPEALYSSTMIAIARVMQLITDEGLQEKFAARTAGFDNRWWRYGYAKDGEPKGYSAFDWG
jgi:hypothetical protein